MIVLVLVTLGGLLPFVLVAWPYGHPKAQPAGLLRGPPLKPGLSRKRGQPEATISL